MANVASASASVPVMMPKVRLSNPDRSIQLPTIGVLSATAVAGGAMATRRASLWRLSRMCLIPSLRGHLEFLERSRADHVTANPAARVKANQRILGLGERVA